MGVWLRLPLGLGWERERARVEGEERGGQREKRRGGPGPQPMAATQPVSPRHLCQHDAPHVKNVPRAVCLGDLQRNGRLGHHEMMAGLGPDPDLQCSTPPRGGGCPCIHCSLLCSMICVDVGTQGTNTCTCEDIAISISIRGSGRLKLALQIPLSRTHPHSPGTPCA